MDKTIVLIAKERPELLEEISERLPLEVIQDKTSYFKIENYE
jgi:hypothetical protein